MLFGSKSPKKKVKQKKKGFAWSKYYEFCVECCKTQHKHASKGLCFRCYDKKRWLNRDKEKQKERDREYRNKNKEKMCAKNQRYYKNNRNKILIQKKTYLMKKKAEINKKKRAHYKENETLMRAKNRKYYQDNNGKIRARATYRKKQLNLFINMLILHPSLSSVIYQKLDFYINSFFYKANIPPFHDKWSRYHNKCINCKTTKINHQAKGLCQKCYYIHKKTN